MSKKSFKSSLLSMMMCSTDYGHPVRKSPSLHSRKSNPNPKFLGTADAYVVCHIGPIFQICLINAFIGCPQSVSSSSRRVDDNQLSWIDRPPTMGCNKQYVCSIRGPEGSMNQAVFNSDTYIFELINVITTETTELRPIL